LKVKAVFTALELALVARIEVAWFNIIRTEEANKEFLFVSTNQVMNAVNSQV
jgi:hypothetical protein